MRVEILGQERRRRWGDAKKLDVVMSIGLDGATVTEVAHRHDVSRQQIYAWRHELKKKGLLPSTADTVFVPVDTATALTDDGIDELRQMLADARRSPEAWNDFLDCFVDDEEVIARVKAKSPR
ncbi:transposase [Sinorhizobium meliloti]|uniref:Transposase n=1 Tax=Rhizobium meliloti TaxID=382 RepID=A0A2J0YWW0_RHIML|nr:transposase [Sinorhizobium meliloti]PJR12766.1 hypothetical protein CEJ86_24560 [Sinorhizobium meliloti]